MMSTADVFIDSPIHLQGLPAPQNVEYQWELTFRPVDFALDALAPLADKIGSLSARVQALLSTSSMDSLVKGRLFESYPAASLRMLGQRSRNYKGDPATSSGEGSWESAGNFGRLLEALRFSAQTGDAITDDDFDATLCALCGVIEKPDLLAGNELARFVREKLVEKGVRSEDAERMSTPINYVLLRSFELDRVTICIDSRELTPELVELYA